MTLRLSPHDGPPLERNRPPGALEVGGGHPPRLPDRGLAARQRNGLEVCDPLERRRGRSEAPRRPRAFHPSRIPCRRGRPRVPRPSRRALPGTRRRGRGDAGPRRAGGPARRPTWSRGTRGGDRTRRPRADVEHVEVEREVGAERRVGGLAVEIAEVRGEECLGVARDAERALQLGPDRDDRRASPARGAAAAPGA